MSKYKIHIDKQPKSKEEHEKDMNFDKLMEDYKKYYSPFKTRQLMFKDRKLIMLFVVIIALALAIYTSMKNPPKEKEKTPPSSKSTGMIPGTERIIDNTHNIV